MDVIRKHVGLITLSVVLLVSSITGIAMSGQDIKDLSYQHANNSLISVDDNGVPKIEGMSYDDARKSLIESGWKPKLSGPPELVDGFDERYNGNGILFWKRGYKEIEACAGTGTAPCVMNFQNEQGQVLRVITNGEEWDEDELTKHAIVTYSSLRK
jgi:hypothetical protein